MSGDPNCVVCEGAGWDWRRAADEQQQIDDPVDYYRCPCVEVMRLKNDLQFERDANNTMSALVTTISAEHAAERALTKQMARALAAVKADRPSVHTHEVWTAVCDALDDYGKARREVAE